GARRASSPERIMVRAVNWLGDAVMTTPALLRLRQARPEAQITLFTPEKLAEIWKEHPAVDAVLTFSRPEALWRIARRLRQGQFQIGLALPNSHRSALELWLAGIPRRIGCDARWRNWFLTDCVRSPAGAVKMRKRSIREIRRLVRAGYGDATVPAGCASFPGTAHHVHQYLRL